MDLGSFQLWSSFPPPLMVLTGSLEATWKIVPNRKYIPEGGYASASGQWLHLRKAGRDQNQKELKKERLLSTSFFPLRYFFLQKINVSFPHSFSPLVTSSSLYLWFCFFFVITTSLLYFLDFRYKWYYTVLVFVWFNALQKKKDVLFIIGDWNAKVGSQETLGVTDKLGLGIWNEAGQRLIEFCQENALVITNTLLTTQEKTLHMDITRWSTPKSDWLCSLQPKIEKLYTVNKNKTRSWLIEESRENH